MSEVNAETFLVTSKVVGDNLPLTTTQVQIKPCLDPRQLSRAPGKLFYPLEGDKTVPGCLAPDFYGVYNDERYMNLGGQTNEWDVQSASPVLGMLQRLPRYGEYGVSQQIKQTYTYDFWARPTIGWNLSCEDSLPRQTIWNRSEVEVRKEDLNAESSRTLVLFGGIGGFSLVCFMILFYACECFTGKFAMFKKGVFCCAGCIEMAVFISALVYTYRQQDSLVLRHSAMLQLDKLTGCGDDYTQVPPSYTKEIQTSIPYSKVALACTTGLICLACISCTCVAVIRAR